MCRTILSRFINSSTHRTAIIVIHHHGQELIHDLDFHLPAQSDSAIDCCDVHRRCFSGMQMKSMRLTHLSIWAITSVIYSVQVRIIHLKWHVSSKTRHIICLIHHHDRYVDDVDVLLSSALYLLPRHKISFDHDHSINGRRSSSILLICQLTTLSACWDHPYISSSIILLARLLQSKSWAREIFISTAPKWHVCSQQAIILLWPYAPRLLWYISIHEFMSALAHRHIRWLSFASILELKLRELDIHICQVWYWYHLSSSSSISSMTPINSMVAMCYIFKSRVIWKSLKLSNTLLFTTRSQEVVILEDECWFISVSRLHLPLQLVLEWLSLPHFVSKISQVYIFVCNVPWWKSRDDVDASSCQFISATHCSDHLTVDFVCFIESRESIQYPTRGAFSAYQLWVSQKNKL